MEFRHLRYFVVLADELHFGRAAERLHITQPPLSMNIRQLEQSMGARLFDRNSKAVALTAAGRAFLPAAQALLANADEAAQLARAVDQGVAGRLRIGFVGSMLYRGLPTLLKAFEHRHPRLRVELAEVNSQDQIAELSRGQLDCGFVHQIRVPAGLAQQVVSDEPFVCCLPAAHHQAGAASIALAELEHESLVMFSRAASPDYYEQIMAVCSRAGLFPDVRHQARHWASVVALVAQGLGVALVPAAMAKSGTPGVRYVGIRGATQKSQVYCVWQRAHANPALQAFLTAVQAWAASPALRPARARAPRARRST